MAQTSETSIIITEDNVIHSDKEIMGGTPVFKGTRVPVKNLFDLLIYGRDLKDFHFEFPSVHPKKVVAALERAKKVMVEEACRKPDGLFHSDPKEMGGEPVCVGTRHQLKSLFDCLIQVQSLKDFHFEFPSMHREQTLAALNMARQLLEQEAYATAAR